MASIWGEDYDGKNMAFNKRVEEIENRYADLFKDKKSVITGEKPDNLRNQFIPSFDGRKHAIGFIKETYVPKHIQDEVIQVFVSIVSVK